MLNLKLLSQLQGDAMTNILLRESAPGKLQYFLTTYNVNYSIVVSGYCDGSIPSSDPITFDLLLSSIAPLLERNTSLVLKFQDGVLSFSDTKGKFDIVPLHVEHIADDNIRAVQKFLEFTEAMEKQTRVREDIDRAKLEKAQLEYAKRREGIEVAESYMLDSSPFDIDRLDNSESKVNSYFDTKIQEVDKHLQELEDSMQILTPVDLSQLHLLSHLAARYSTTLSCCDDYAVVSLRESYIFQRVQCGTRVLNGSLLSRLLRSDGQFYLFKGELLYTQNTYSADGASMTCVFLQSYLPNLRIDSSLVTKGKVLEQYTVDFSELTSFVKLTSNKFDIMEFDMGGGRFRLSNERGEQFIHRLNIKEVETVELKKMIKGTYSGPITMTTIAVPKEVQKLVPFIEGDLVISVKERKIIFQFGNLFVVFGR